MSIHATALIDPKARLGRNVTVGPFAVIEADVEIGDNCTVGPHATVMRYTTLGEGCRVHAGAVLGDWPQDMGFKPDELSHVRIGKHVTLREFVTIHRGTKAGTVTELGDGCFLMANAHVAHNVRLGARVIIANGVLLAGYVDVGDGAFLSGHVVVHQFVRIGRLAMVGGASGLSKDVPPFCMVGGMARNQVAGLNVIGMRRAGLNPDQRKAVKAAFGTLYRSGLNVGQAVKEIKATAQAGSAAAEMAAFVEESKRGICRYGADESGEASAED
jgi:UDP-N-acetylglucosamine acyltransferase